MQRTLRVVDGAINAVIVLLFAVILVAMFAQVVFRYVIGSPLSWSEEVSRYMFVWLCYLGAYVAILRGAHIGGDYLTSRFSAGIVRGLNVGLGLIIIGSLIFVAYRGVLLALDNVGAGWWTVSFLSMSLPYAAVPVGAALMILAFIRVMVSLMAGEAAHPTLADIGETQGL
jgi:TRAP-type C4-dicarboxylate transport system permease small subunit